MALWLFRLFVVAGFLVVLAPPPAAAQEGGGGDTHVGDVFGDLYHIKRDLQTGQPILQKRMIEYPEDVVDWGYCPIPVDAYGQEIPFVDLSCDVDPAHLTRLVELDYFGRLSGGRTRERNIRMHFDEVILSIKEAEVVTLEPGGRFRLGTACTNGVCAQWRIIDSPQENLAVYNRLIRYGHIQTDPLEVDSDFHGDPQTGTVYHPALAEEDWAKFSGALTNVLPGGRCFTGEGFDAACALPEPLTDADFVRAASFLAGAADKNGRITLDLVQYLNRILKVTKSSSYALANAYTLPALIRDENNNIAPAPEGLPAPADERFVNYAAAAYTREAHFGLPMETALVSAGPGAWTETPNVSFMDFLRFINGPAAPLANAPAFVANGLDAVRAIEFIHNYEVPSDIRAAGAFTSTAVPPQTTGISAGNQLLALTATVVDQLPVNGGTVTFTIQSADGTVAGTPAVSVPVTNGGTMAQYLLPPVATPGTFTVIGAFSGAPGFAPSYGTGVLTITSTPVEECAATLTPPSADSPMEGGTASVQLTILSSCGWTAVSDAPWLELSSSAGTGSAAIEYTTEPNLTGAPRSANVVIAGQLFTVRQSATCAYQISTEALSFPMEGGAAVVDVTALAGCSWAATTNVPWLTVTEGASGTGPGSFTVVAGRKAATGERAGIISIGSENVVTVHASQTGGASAPYDVTRWELTGDVRTDITVWRPGSGVWYVWNTAARTVWASLAWGTASDQPVPGDYDGDGLGDLAVWRADNGLWYVLKSTTDYIAALALEWGAGWAGDIPVPADYDGDGRTDIAVWRPSTGMWYVKTSSSGFASSFAVRWGLPGDTPAPGDYDGDGRADIAVWRASTGTWYMLRSHMDYDSGYPFTKQWGNGAAGDLPVPGDYDGDGTTDIAVWRGPTGGWHLLGSSGQFEYAGATAFTWGDVSLGDRPIVGDYDGDGRTDLVVWRASTGVWYVKMSSTNFVDAFAERWGIASYGDVPIPNR